MSVAAIADSLPMAVGVALSPLPVAAVVTVLLSGRVANALGFLLGWTAGILVVGALVFLVPGLESARGDPTPLAGWIRLGAGVLLLVLAARQWQQRPADDDPLEMPKMLASLENAGAGKTTYIGFGLSALNPKNLLLTSTGAAYIYAAAELPVDRAGALVVYALIASASVIVPVVGQVLFAERMQAKLDDWKDWLIRNNAGVMTALLTVIGALIIGGGLKILFA